jgi:hypothetical protein
MLFQPGLRIHAGEDCFAARPGLAQSRVTMHRRFFLLILPFFLAFSLLNSQAVLAGSATSKLPSQLTDKEFWRLVSEFSEPGGTFHSENLVSNEARYQGIIPDLVKVVKQGQVYMGVGPEQNFTYMTATRPAMAFILDIRRGNLDVHLMYKALFELSTDRAEFVSRLFSRKRPRGLTAESKVEDIFAAYKKVPGDKALYEQNLQAIKSHLMTKHGFALTKGDLEGIEFAYSSFFASGPEIEYQLTGGGGSSRRNQAFGRSLSPSIGMSIMGMGGHPSYADLMTATDSDGKQHSYLSTEERFKFLKDLEARNMVVPVVGNFAGPKAIRAVGSYLKQKGAVVSTFYMSNVEQYLSEGSQSMDFCYNVATLPLDSTSTLIRSIRGGSSGGGRFSLSLGAIAAEVVSGCGPIR